MSLKYKNYLLRFRASLYITLIAIISLIFQFSAEAQFFKHPYKNLEPLSTMRDLQYPFQVNYLTLSNQTEIAYVDEGSGTKTLLFIHGLGSYLPAWQKNIEALKQQYRCIALDLPGYGKSSKEPHSGKMSYYADMIHEFITQLGIDKVVLVGHSMGGQISIMYAINYPESVQSLILAAPAGFEQFNEGQKQWFRDVMTLNGVKLTPVQDIQNNLAYNFYNMPKDADFMIRDRIAMRSADDFEAYCYAIVRSVNGMVDEPVFDWLKEIKHPVLVIFGENDNLIPNRYLNPGKTSSIAKAGADQIANSTLVMLPKTGHFLQFESYDAFNAHILDFLSGQIK